MSTTKTRVVFFINTFLLGGIEKVLIEYLKNINKEKFEVSLLIGLNMGDAQVLINQLPSDVAYSYLVNSTLINHYKIKKILSRKKLHLAEKVIEALILTPICKLFYSIRFKQFLYNKDVIVDFGFSYKIPKSDIPIVSFMHFSLQSYLNWDINKHSKSYKKLLKQFEQRNAIVTLNEEMMNEILKSFPSLERKLEMIYNPFDLNKVREQSSLSLGSLEYIGHSGYILTVCRLNEGQKDIACLIKAFDILVRKYNYLGKLVIVGDGSSLSQLNALVCSLGLSEKVHFEGFRENTLNYMKHADIFVLSSKYEGLPGVLIEAIAVGVPAISSDCPTGPREILLNGDAGMLFEIGNHKQLSDMLNELLEDDALKNKLIVNGLSRSQDFSIECNVIKLEKILSRVNNEKN